MEALASGIGGIMKAVTISPIQFVARKSIGIQTLATNIEKMYLLLQNIRPIFHRCGLTRLELEKAGCGMDQKKLLSRLQCLDMTKQFQKEILGDPLSKR